MHAVGEVLFVGVQKKVDTYSLLTCYFSVISLKGSMTPFVFLLGGGGMGGLEKK